MFPQTVEIEEGSQVVIGDLTIKNNEGGHEITTQRTDLSFAVLSFATPRMTEDTVTAFQAEKGKEKHVIEFDGYHIIIESVAWNGSQVVLTVSLKEE
jgi:hypothetical protein